MLAFRMTLTGEETEIGQKEPPGMADLVLGEKQTQCALTWAASGRLMPTG